MFFQNIQRAIIIKYQIILMHSVIRYLTLILDPSTKVYLTESSYIDSVSLI